jgi:tRNA(Ile)-lysidine synthase
MLTEPDSRRERGIAQTLHEPVVLAVSGGADSMLMAADLLATQPEMVRAIATFDHGTGAAAREAACLVSAWARSQGVPVHVGHGGALPRSEAAWRAARWTFLHRVSVELRARVATAHTEDDQAETVFIRLLRHSGVRGLAGLLAPGPVIRPMLHLSRINVRASAAAAAVPFIDDPSNADVRHLRNRVRLELLPALERAEPGFRTWLLGIGARAAVWRRDVAEAVDSHWAPQVEVAGGRIVVPRDRRRIPSLDEAGLFWPEVAGRIGIALDHRGTARLAAFTTHEATGQEMPLSGGARVTSERGEWSLQRAEAIGASSMPAKRPASRQP